MNRTHTTQPADQGTYHYWEVRGDHGAVSLSLLHSRASGFAPLAEGDGFTARLLAATESGHWVFDVISLHTDGSIGWAPCPVHGACDMNAYVTDVTGPVWARLRESGVTDARVYAELEALFVAEFEEAA